MSAEDDRIENLVLEWYTRFQAGTDASAADLCGGRPDLTAAVAARVDTLRRAERTRLALGGPPTAGPPGPGTAFDFTTLLQPAHDGGDELGWRAGFRVLRLLGKGGMGAVFLAEDPRARRLVALKVLRPDRTSQPVARERFLREARAAAALHHDNLMPVFQVGEEDRIPFLVMPYYPGETLAGRFADRSTRGPLPPADLARAGRHVAQGLAAAHARGIVHRDLKPSNVWLEELPDPDDGPPWRARVIDFGLALDLAEADRLTASGFHLGTPEYMSPEQADGQPVDGRSDLFALGDILYEGAVGWSPFGGSTHMIATLNAIVTRPVDPAPLAAAGLPARFAAIVLKLLAKEPADRPKAAADVAADLRAVEKELRR